MDSLELIRRVRKATKALRRASSWNGSWQKVDAESDDFVYEHLCYLKATLMAEPSFRLKVVTRPHRTTGKPTALWPRKPGKKSTFSYFLLSSRVNNANVFQLCPGIRIGDKDGKYRAPDINLLKGNCSDSPSHSDLLGIWDAKYLSKKGASLPDTQVSDFVFTFEQLGSPNPPSAWCAAVGAPVFQGSGLITNGEFSTERNATLAQRQVRETKTYPDNPETRP